jgi:hypothetical protein
MTATPRAGERYAVAFAPSAAAVLTPPPRSLIDGGEGELVSVLCDGTAGTRVRLRVDEPTVRVLAGIARSYRTVRWRVAPALAVLVVAAGVAAVMASGVALFTVLPAVLLLLYTAIWSGVVAFKISIRKRRKSIAQYPGRVARGDIVMCGLDPAAAEEWIGANPGLIRRVE